MGAVACGVKEGTLTKILGTSTCDITVCPSGRELADIPGVCGIVDGSVLPGHYGIEAGQSAVGDIFHVFLGLAPVFLQLLNLLGRPLVSAVACGFGLLLQLAKLKADAVDAGLCFFDEFRSFGCSGCCGFHWIASV
jgi:ribulose kinase